VLIAQGQEAVMFPVDRTVHALDSYTSHVVARLCVSIGVSDGAASAAHVLEVPAPCLGVGWWVPTGLVASYTRRPRTASASRWPLEAVEVRRRQALEPAAGGLANMK
jgi:hypothetical protein